MSQNNQDPTQQRPAAAQGTGQMGQTGQAQGQKGASQSQKGQSQSQGQNQGEGNREAAANFNRAEREYVQSPRGQQKIHEGTHVAPGEEGELSEAERRAKERAKAQDSNRMG